MQEALSVFKEYVRSNNLRYTPEREEIIREIFSTQDHFDVSELYLRLKKKNYKISKASIYRTIPLLIDSGLIRQVYHQEGHHHYEHTLGVRHHCHLFCNGCGAVVEFIDDYLEEVEEKLSKKFGYRVESHRLEDYGLCPKCQNLNDG